MITEDYVSFETAKLLKEKGFDEPCVWAYDPNSASFSKSYHEPKNSTLNEYEYSQPTLQMAMKWLRETHNIFIELSAGETNGKTWYDFDIIPINGREIAWNHYNNLPVVECNSYEEACEAAIKYSLENLV